MGRHLFAGQLCACFDFRHLMYTCSFTFDSKETPWPSTLQHGDNNQFLELYTVVHPNMRLHEYACRRLFALASPSPSVTSVRAT